MYSQIDVVRQEVLNNNFPEELLSEEFQFCLEHVLSKKERQLVEHLIEGYPEDEISRLLFDTKAMLYRMYKSKAKRKILNFLSL